MPDDASVIRASGRDREFDNFFTQTGGDNGVPSANLEGGRLPPQRTKLDERVDEPQEMVSGNVPFAKELIEQSSPFDLPMSHHVPVLPLTATESVNVMRRNCRFFQKKRPEAVGAVTRSKITRNACPVLRAPSMAAIRPSQFEARGSLVFRGIFDRFAAPL
jgi:hypothetical protein